MSGSLVGHDAWFDAGSAAFTRPSRPRTSLAIDVQRPRAGSRRCPGSRATGRRAARRAARSARSASSTTSGPAGREPAPRLGAVEHERIARASSRRPGRLRQVPGDRDVHRASPRRDGSPATACRRSSRPAPWRPVATGSPRWAIWPGLAQRPSTSSRGRSMPSNEPNGREVRDGLGIGRGVGVGRRMEDDRDLAAGLGDAPAGAPADRPPRRSAAAPGRILVRTTIARSAAGADDSSRCSPASVTASVYSVPAASSDSALASSANEAITTGRSARLRRSTVDHRPRKVGSERSPGGSAAGVTRQ